MRMPARRRLEQGTVDARHCGFNAVHVQRAPPRGVNEQRAGGLSRGDARACTRVPPAHCDVLVASCRLIVDAAHLA